MNNCDIEIHFDYLNQFHTIKLESGELCNDIRNNIMPMRIEPVPIWFPNDDIDNKIRKYIFHIIKTKPYYKKGVHPYNMIIYLNGTKYHVIPEYLSDERKQEIIGKIKSEYK